MKQWETKMYESEPTSPRSPGHELFHQHIKDGQCKFKFHISSDHVPHERPDRIPVAVTRVATDRVEKTESISCKHTGGTCSKCSSHKSHSSAGDRTRAQQFQMTRNEWVTCPNRSARRVVAGAGVTCRTEMLWAISCLDSLVCQ